MTVYKLSPDGVVTGVTVVTTGLLLGMAVVFAWVVVSYPLPAWARWLLTGCMALLIGIIAVSYAYSPRRYELDAGALTVKRMAGDVVVPLETIRDVRSDPAPFAGALRVAGNGGLFGFWGRFRSERMAGSFSAYATRRDRGVVVKTVDKTIVLTPDEPERLVAELESRRAGGGGR